MYKLDCEDFACLSPSKARICRATAQIESTEGSVGKDGAHKSTAMMIFRSTLC